MMYYTAKVYPWHKRLGIKLMDAWRCRFNPKPLRRRREDVPNASYYYVTYTGGTRAQIDKAMISLFNNCGGANVFLFRPPRYSHGAWIVDLKVFR